MSGDPVTAVIVAAAQSVAKVFVIGSAGWGATRIPKQRPLLDTAYVPQLARFSFHCLTLSLIYSTTAQSVNFNSIGNYWFLIAGALYVLGLSYGTATVLGRCILLCSTNNSTDFTALRIAATFPNIVALPILIFPSLCEFAVVHEGYYQRLQQDDDNVLNAAQLQDRCEVESNTMIFCYFFSWSLGFWTLGYPQLMAAATQKRDETTAEAAAARNTITANDDSAAANAAQSHGALALTEEGHRVNEDNATRQQSTAENSNEGFNIESTWHSSSPTAAIEETDDDDEDSSTVVVGRTPSNPSWYRQKCQTITGALQKTFTSPGFLALLAGIVMGCIPPLQKELFEPAGALRFLGDALETLGQASSPMSTMVVAASLVPVSAGERGDSSRSTSELLRDDCDDVNHEHNSREQDDADADDDVDEHVDNPIMSDPNFGPAPRRRKARLRRLSRSVRRGSARIIKSIRSSSSTPASQNNKNRDSRRLLVWFVLSRLFVAPALVVGTIVGLDCGGAGLLDGVPNLAKLVVIVNSCLPGALIVVVLLKSNPSLSESAAAVAQVYLPSYLLSIITIAGWTALGLYVTLPDEDGNTFCHR